MKTTINFTNRVTTNTVKTVVITNVKNNGIFVNNDRKPSGLCDEGWDG